MEPKQPQLKHASPVLATLAKHATADHAKIATVQLAQGDL